MQLRRPKTSKQSIRNKVHETTCRFTNCACLARQSVNVVASSCPKASLLFFYLLADHVFYGVGYTTSGLPEKCQGDGLTKLKIINIGRAVVRTKGLCFCTELFDGVQYGFSVAIFWVGSPTFRSHL